MTAAEQYERGRAGLPPLPSPGLAAMHAHREQQRAAYPALTAALDALEAAVTAATENAKVAASQLVADVQADAESLSSVVRRFAGPRDQFVTGASRPHLAAELAERAATILRAARSDDSNEVETGLVTAAQALLARAAALCDRPVSPVLPVIDNEPDGDAAAEQQGHGLSLPVEGEPADADAFREIGSELFADGVIDSELGSAVVQDKSHDLAPSSAAGASAARVSVGDSPASGLPSDAGDDTAGGQR